MNPRMKPRRNYVAMFGENVHEPRGMFGKAESINN